MQQIQQQKVTSLQSLNLIQNILLSSIGCVSYVRGLFPDDSFETKGLDGIAVKCLRKDQSTEGNALLSWLETGCFDALKKQYLQTLVFGIYLNQDDPSDLVESYEFNFSYPSKDSYAFELFSTGSRASEEPSRSEVAKTTHQLVRRLLVLTQSLEPLPEHAFITMRLYYTDDTPIEYEPPQFMPCTSDNLQPVGQDVKIGKVQTKHHEMTCKVTTRASDIPRPNVEESTQDLIKGLNLRPCSLEPTQTKDEEEEEEEEGLSINVIDQNRLSLSEEHELLNQLFGGESGDSELDRLPLPLPLDMDLDLDLDQDLLTTSTAVAKSTTTSNAKSTTTSNAAPKSTATSKSNAAKTRGVLLVKESVYNKDKDKDTEQTAQKDNDDDVVIHGTQIPTSVETKTNNVCGKVASKVATKVAKELVWGCLCNHSVLKEFPALQECKSCARTCHVVCYGLTPATKDSLVCSRCTAMASTDDLYLLSVYRRGVDFLSRNEMPRSRSMLTRALLGVSRDSKESLAMTEPLFVFLQTHKIITMHRKRESASGKMRTSYSVNAGVGEAVWADELGYAVNLKRSGRGRDDLGSEAVVVEGVGMGLQPPVLAKPPKRRKVSVVQQDLAVL